MNADVFSYEINLIKEEPLREFAKKAISIVPEYISSIPASSTGKYHPAFSLGEGGLVNHIKAVTRLGYELFEIQPYGEFSKHQQDLVLIALLLHDGWKSGLEHSQYSVAEHPLIASQELKKNFYDTDSISNEDLNFICEAIETHMGKWVNDYKSGQKVLEPPRNPVQRFVHLCDYTVSRKMFKEIDFEVGVTKR